MAFDRIGLLQNEINIEVFEIKVQSAVPLRQSFFTPYYYILFKRTVIIQF